MTGGNEPRCEMSKTCSAAVTHIGESGFIYCAEHAKVRRRTWERCRRMRIWELALIREGRPLPTYRRLPKRSAMANGGREVFVSSTITADIMRRLRDRNAVAKYRQANRQARRDENKAWHEKNVERSAFNAARSRAKARGLAFSISFDEIPWCKTCPVFGFPFTRARASAMQSMSLDRIDNAKGYIRGNVIVVSKLANTIKNCASVGMLRRVADFYETIERTGVFP